ncbi:hypothetical protein XA68_15394 [Ophiocordyceps unilateralis]|uniref:Uncharacterized protein n=1 Tax=Ophiocordyceps unilateralis TaxID=268505 RepID=A0A2A9P7A0_OPHUN|nr:hypothetical protein XA68_15394 [Ophiocordyceps unilateralis]
MSITTDFSPTSHYAPSTSVSAPAKAPRSQRPWEEVVTPCIRLVQSSTSSPSPPDENRRPPLSPVMNWHPFPPRSSSALDANGRPRTATSSRQGHYQQSSSSHPRAPRHHKSMAHFPPPPPPPPPPEPQSVFESDSDDSDSDHPRSFFRFHRRNDSDSRRSAKPPPTPDGGPPVRSSRPQTAPSLADLTSNSRLVKQEPQRRKRQGHDVFGRMLGRRSR